MSKQDKHSPAFQFYPKDFMTSEKVAEMTFTEKGIYLHLLCLCWTNQGIKQDTRFERIIGPEWEDAKDVVMGCFEVIDDRLWNQRLYREKKKQDQYADKKRRAGKASGKARKSRNTKDKEQVFNSIRTKDEQTGTFPSPISHLPSPIPNTSTNVDVDKGSSSTSSGGKKLVAQVGGVTMFDFKYKLGRINEAFNRLTTEDIALCFSGYSDVDGNGVLDYMSKNFRGADIREPQKRLMNCIKKQAEIEYKKRSNL